MNVHLHDVVAAAAPAAVVVGGGLVRRRGGKDSYHECTLIHINVCV